MGPQIRQRWGKLPVWRVGTTLVGARTPQGRKYPEIGGRKQKTVNFPFKFFFKQIEFIVSYDILEASTKSSPVRFPFIVSVTDFETLQCWSHRLSALSETQARTRKKR